MNNVVNALDGALLVRVAEIGGVRYAAVWHGGVSVNVYDPTTWNEVGIFTLMDEQGRAESRDAVEVAMEEHFEQVGVEAGVEVCFNE